MGLTLRQALQLLYQALVPFSDTPVLDAQVALAVLLNRPRAWVLAHLEDPFPEHLQPRLHQWVHRLRRGEPLPYLLGQWEFFGRSFYVSPAVLIPRPETETLVERALNLLSPNRSYRVVDVGTGTGCIALTLALERPCVQVWATDISWPALLVARRNRACYQVEDRVRLVQASLLTPFRGAWDLVVANLPYVPSRQVWTLPAAAFEPHQALDGGPDGLHWIRTLLTQLVRQLAPGGHALLEISPEQKAQLQVWLWQHFSGWEILWYRDLAGRWRVLHLRKP